MPDVNLTGNEKVVIVENGRVVPGTYASVAAAEAKIAERKKVAESAGSPAPQVEVKQQLFG